MTAKYLYESSLTELVIVTVCNNDESNQKQDLKKEYNKMKDIGYPFGYKYDNYIEILMDMLTKLFRL